MVQKARYIKIGGTARSPEDVVILKKIGLQFAEIPLSNDAQFINRIDQYNELRKSLGMYYLGHGPREGDPNDVESLENVYLEKIRQILPLMEKLEMNLLTVHLWLDQRFIKPDVIRFKLDFLRRIIDFASERGILICLENLSERVSDFEQFFLILPDLNMTLDLGHAQLLTEQNRSTALITKYPERIKHIHMHDNRGGYSAQDDTHLPPGNGVIDFWPIFREIHKMGYDRTITLELKPYEIEKCLHYVNMLIAGLKDF